MKKTGRRVTAAVLCVVTALSLMAPVSAEDSTGAAVSAVPEQETGAAAAENTGNMTQVSENQTGAEAAMQASVSDVYAETDEEKTTHTETEIDDGIPASAGADTGADAAEASAVEQPAASSTAASADDAQRIVSGEKDAGENRTSGEAKHAEMAGEIPGESETEQREEASEAENGQEDTDEEDGEAEEGEEDMEESEEEGDKETAPAASARLLVKTDDVSVLDEDAVIAVMEDVYLLQFDSKEAAGEALAVYEEEAEFVAEDLTIRAATYGEFPVSDEEADMIMTEAANPFVEAEQTATVPASGGVIALIDTGVSATKEVVGRLSVLGDDGADAHGHGDAMYDTIRNYNPKARVLSIKALDASGIGTVSALYAAIRLAIDSGVSVINLSLSAHSTGENAAVASILREATAQGIVVVGAAGNNGTDAASYLPACIPEVLVAGACNNAGQRLPSSNYGSTVDLLILAGSSSYAAATLSGIISVTGAVPSPDGNAVFAPGGAAAASDYVDGLCYDNTSGNFAAAGVTYTVHNAGGSRLSDLIPGLTYDSLQAWLGSHEEDDYYLGTPYPEQLIGGIPQYILGRSGDCDNRNPNGDCQNAYGNDDYPGRAMMNCTGFVWHALWKASGLSYTDGISRIPAWGGIGAGSWKSYIQNHQLEYMTVKSGGTNEINQMLATAMWSAKGSDGKPFLEKGDIIWFWVDQIPLGSDDLPVNGYYGGLADKAHVGIYWPETEANDNRWWDSIGICEYQGESGQYFRNMLHAFTPKTGSVAMTIIKLDHKAPVMTKANVQKISASREMTEGNACYDLTGAVYTVYGSEEDAAANRDPIATCTTDAGGYGETEEVLHAGETYYLRETAPPENGSYLPDAAVYSFEAKEPDKVTKETALQPEEVPAHDAAAVVIEKVSSSGVPAAEGKSLAGTQFTIRYYQGIYTQLSELPAPERTWVLETKNQPDGACRACLLPEYRVAGDDFYVLPGNPDPVLPLGTITIEETKAAEGYLLENTYTNGNESAAGPVLVTVRKSGDAVQLRYGDTALREDGFTASDTPIRGGVKLQKLDGDMQLDMDGRPYAEGDKSLAGAEFTIYSKNAYTVRNADGAVVTNGGVMQVIQTDADGAAQTGVRDLPYGTYEIRESKASPGYTVPASWGKTISIWEDGVYVDLTQAADACYEPDIRGGVQVQKTDRETGEAEALGGGSLAGITYRILNRSQHAVKNKAGEIVAVGGVMQEIVTDRNGIAATDAADLPYGTYLLQECAADEEGYAANESYLTEGAADVTFRIREDGKIVTTDTNGKKIVFANQVKRNDLSFRKVEGGTDRPLGRIPFVIENTATGERHVIVTDESGAFSSAKYPHSRRTNANDAVLENASGETEISVEALDVKAGCWFGRGKNGSMAEADDALPAFPYGTYTITELRCAANAGYALIQNYPFVIAEDRRETGGERVDLNNLHNLPVLPEIRTRALDDKTGEHLLLAEQDAHITDTVFAKNLQKGQDYVLVATLMDEESENAVRCGNADGIREKVTGEAAFTATEGAMEIPVPLSFDATALAGRTLVVYEVLYLVEKDGSRTPIADHRELTDREQTVFVPEVQTTFLDAETGTQTGAASGAQQVKDLVRYTGLIPGKEMSVTATVMTVDADGNEQALTDRDGNPFTKTVTFTPEKSEGSVPVEFTIDTSLLSGGKAVCFEEIRCGEHPVAIHADLEDQAQTIRYPAIRTTAADAATGEHVAAVSEQGTFVDTVFCSGLQPGERYTAKAVLMDADAGTPIEADGTPVTGETAFTAQAETGTVSVELPVPAAAIAGRTTVVFEELWTTQEDNGTAVEKKVAEHKDPQDPDQQIYIPKIQTTLTDAATGSHSAVYGENIVLTDTVRYRGLLSGKSYRLSAVLMTVDAGGNAAEAKDADGVPYTAEKSFTASAAEGEETVEFTVDTSVLAGKRLVCFETLYLDKVQLAVHADVGDAEQTVVVPAIRTRVKDAVTGIQLASAGKTAFTDTVSYTHLVPGTSYIVRGVLADAKTGRPVSAGLLKQVTGETGFIPEQADGTAEVSFSVDTTELSGKTLVVLEELYVMTEDGRELPVAEHKDLTDTKQQIRIPEVRTSAAVNGAKTCVAGKDTVLTDTVTYSNLAAGETYVLRGTLVDKSSRRSLYVNGSPLRAETVFTAAADHGTEKVMFSFDSTLLEKKTVVVFEDLYLQDADGREVKIASHADAGDAAQSVKIKATEKAVKKKVTLTPPPAPAAAASAAEVSAPATGDAAGWRIYVLLVACAAAAGTVLVFVRKKKKS